MAFAGNVAAAGCFAGGAAVAGTCTGFSIGGTLSVRGVSAGGATSAGNAAFAGDVLSAGTSAGGTASAGGVVTGCPIPVSSVICAIPSPDAGPSGAAVFTQPKSRQQRIAAASICFLMLSSFMDMLFLGKNRPFLPGNSPVSRRAGFDLSQY
jgi:hypothetical protein